MVLAAYDRTRGRQHWRSVLLTCAWSTTACTSTCDGDSQPDVSVIGELGNGEFRYTCAGSSDPLCYETSHPSFPDCILRGGQFDLDYVLQDRTALIDEDDEHLIFVEPASKQWFSYPLPSVAQQVGRAAMIARTDDNVLDVFHFDIVEADQFDVRDMGGSQVSQFTVAQDDAALFDVIADSTACFEAGGALPLDVVNADSSIARGAVTPEGLVIHGVHAGTTTITVKVGDMQQAIIAVVTAATPGSTSTADTSTGSGTGSDSGTDSGSGSGTDSGSDSGSDTAGTSDSGSSSTTGGT